MPCDVRGWRSSWLGSIGKAGAYTTFWQNMAGPNQILWASFSKHTRTELLTFLWHSMAPLKGHMAKKKIIFQLNSGISEAPPSGTWAYSGSNANSSPTNTEWLSLELWLDISLTFTPLALTLQIPGSLPRPCRSSPPASWPCVTEHSCLRRFCLLESPQNNTLRRLDLPGDILATCAKAPGCVRY